MLHKCDKVLQFALVIVAGTVRVALVFHPPQIRIDDLLQRAEQFSMHSVATTDHGTMFGVLEFYEKATKVGIKPIIGIEIYVAPRSRFDKTPLDNKGLSHLILLAETQEGYRNLCKFASAAQL
mgnify:CR=1 FL=1